MVIDRNTTRSETSTLLLPVRSPKYPSREQKPPRLAAPVCPLFNAGAVPVSVAGPGGSRKPFSGPDEKSHCRHAVFGAVGRNLVNPQAAKTKATPEPIGAP